MTEDDDRDGRPPDPTEQAKENLKQGLGLLWKAAQDVAGTVRKEIEREGVGKAIDDAGREIARAASNVYERITTELQRQNEPYERAVREAAAREAWPTTREEYERRYGPIHDGNWPRSADEYRRRYGEDPPAGKPKGPTPSDPGFRIAVDDEEPR
jgi:hypothetical protein